MDDSDDQASNQNMEDEIQRELSESDSASCNSISNPYYDGPRRENQVYGEDEGAVQVYRGSQDTFAGSEGGGLYRPPVKNNEMVVISCDLGYFKTCVGFLRTVQVVSQV